MLISKGLLLVILLIFAPLFAQAKTPPEVLQPYKQYVSALEAGDVDEAGARAEQAYNAALRELGRDDPLIGTLAHNLADLLYDDPDRQIKLYRQAIALTPMMNADDIIIVAQRWVALGQAHAVRPVSPLVDFKSSAKDISEGWEFIEEQSLQDTTFGGEMMVLKGWAAASLNKVDEALSWYEKADVIFSGPNHEYFSLLEYMNKVLRGKTLIVYDRNIEGAIVLQDVMQNLEGKLPADHPYVKDAFNTWLWARSKIEQSGDTENAATAGVCKCWPYDEISKKAPVPIVRMPPIMPSAAKRSGRVMMRFSVSRDGSPEDIEIIGYTDKVFIRSASRAIKKWKYDVNEDHSYVDLQKIVTTISFLLMTERGKLLPENEMTMLLNVGE
ncbi:hypothetical protein GCM10009069_02500 [Algimonas arctica]|uniref:TonB C-terminal domain-containing protein n=1 Tax=Algimonas arctica TaxID=1479486 RepID=A0A8J3CPQ0_9PROT|nr:energy transducer TonB [Algimonas arctica]GHA82796.1 hypothetical protein GCM10009069_02500 [Algimonas arctica]